MKPIHAFDNIIIIDKDDYEDLQAEIEKLKENIREDLEEIERLQGLAKQLCEERNQALEGKKDEQRP